MNLKLGIIGLPNVGKSTLFSAITKLQVEIANYPFATIEPNKATIGLPDKRLITLSKIANSKKILPATFEIIDIAGLVKGASKGEGLGNQFLANIREVAAISHILRCFEDKEIIHVNSKIDPIGDLEIVNLELIYADLNTLNNWKQRFKKELDNQKVALIDKLIKGLNQNKLVNQIKLTPEEKEIVQSFYLLSSKKFLYVANIDEKYINDPKQSSIYTNLENYCDQNKLKLLPLAIKTEAQLTQLDDQDQELFLKELNLQENGLTKFIAASFELLNLGVFFTVGPQETRAWTFEKGSNAQVCAGLIHSDFEKGFIRAEVVSYQDFVGYKGWNNAKVAGKIRQEGKKYLIQDGDIVLFRFSV